MSTIPNYDHNFPADLMDLDVTIKEESRIEDDLDNIIKTEPLQIPVPESDPEAVGAIVNRVHCPTKTVGPSKLVKRIEIRLERSEVTNYLASIDKAPVSLSDVKTEPRKPCCPECKKEFADSRGLHRHIKIHSSEKLYVCSTCMHGFRFQSSRDVHARKKHIFKCGNCELSFVLKRSLEEHAIKHHQAVSRICYSCPKCKMEFSKHKKLQCHMKVHSTNCKRPYVCSTCPKSFKYKNHLLRHAFEVHRVECDSNGEVINTTPSIAKAPDLFPAVTIKEEPRTEEVLPTMTTTESLDRSDPLAGAQRKGFQCTTCQLIFKYRFHLQHHQNTNKRCGVQRNQNSNVKLPNPSLSRQCRFPECNKCFPSLYELRRHLVVHSNERPFVCSKCLLAFKFKHHLSRHTQKEHLFQCEHCQLSFLSKYARDVHILKFHPDSIVNQTDSVEKDIDKKNGTSVNKSKLSCPERKKELSRISKLRAHGMVHTKRPCVCSKCFKTFRWRHELSHHFRKEHVVKNILQVGNIKKTFLCSRCPKAYTWKFNLITHTRKEHFLVGNNSDSNVMSTQTTWIDGASPQRSDSTDPNIFPCPNCKKKFTQYARFRCHMMSVHFKKYNPKPYACPKCQFGFKWKSSLDIHIQKEHKYKCMRCELAFALRVRLEEHVAEKGHEEVVRIQKTVPCPECNKNFIHAAFLRSHMSLVHPEERLFSCSKCLNEFKLKNTLLCHSQKEHKFKCKKCKLSFVQQRSLEEHLANGHPAGIRKSLSCPECKRQFAHISVLRLHMAIHSDVRRYVCSKCQMNFKSNRNLSRHTRIEHLFKCESCEDSFLDKHGLEFHVYNYHREFINKSLDISNETKPGPPVFQIGLTCPVCKKDFAKPSILQVHSAVHSNLRPHVCSKCGMTFKLKSHLSRHTRKEHGFKCEYCTFSFIYKPGFDEHVNNCHTDRITNTSMMDGTTVSQKPFPCPKCKKAFSKPHFLQLHMKTHNSARPYVCSTCLLTFKNDYNLITHTRKDHGFKCERCLLLFVCQRHLTKHLSQHTAEDSTKVE